MHFGIICPPVPGHLQPMCSIGRELQARGHRVTLLSIPDVRRHAEAAGVGFEPLGVSDFPEGALDRYLELIQDVDLATIRAGIKWARTMALVLCRDGSEAVTRLGIDALLVDQVQFEGSTIAEVSGVPFVSICSALALDGDQLGYTPPPFISWSPANGSRVLRLRNRLGHAAFAQLVKPVIKTINKFRAAHGLRPLRAWHETMSKLALISSMVHGFDFSRPPRERPFFYTGPYLDTSREPVPFPFERLNGKPLVYASMGTLHTGKIDVYRSIAAACDGLPVQLVISLGRWRGGAPESLSLPGDPIVTALAPQLELLERASLAITHGGLNTAMEALANACPLLAIPVASDQPAVAARIVWSGTGERLPLKKVSPQKLRAAIERILSNESHKQRARVIQEEIRRAGGLKAAADIVENTLRSS